MKLEQNDFPNADIDIDASFGLAVVSTGLGVSITDVGTRMIPVGADVDVDVSAAFPWNIAFRSRLRQAEKSTEASMRESIPKLVDRVIAPLFDAFTMPDHFSLQNVNIFVVQGLGAVTATYCKSLPDIVSPGPAVNG
ncbi:MAG TPA: hypothetical protein VEQ42_03370 [Pyrinomonadaceae bacterium]|nr:hypothetical protein [Pyrinomonadaceae bacterium]